MDSLKRTVIYVSDGTGITAETLGHGLLSQFEGIEFRPMRFPFVDSGDKARDCVARIDEVGRREGVRPIVIMTQTTRNTAPSCTGRMPSSSTCSTLSSCRWRKSWAAATRAPWGARTDRPTRNTTRASPR